MKPLYEDQIHTPAWQKLCDYIWAEKEPRAYELSVKEHHNQNIKLINGNDLPGNSGVIFIGMCHLIEAVFKKLPKDGNYIVVHRTNDRSFTQNMLDKKPASVKHIYTVDCAVNNSNVTAIPFGVSSIMGEDPFLKNIATESKKPATERIFACYNSNRDTKHRNESLQFSRTSPLVKYVNPTISQEEFHRHCRDHEFVLALAGCGADASRQWSSMTLGSIPIVTDVTEMRHFEDMPLVYCPAFNQITDEWLDKAKESIKGKSTHRLRMSFWNEHLSRMKQHYGI